MSTFLFILLIIILFTIFIISSFIAHIQPGRRTIGWWAGILLFLITTASISSEFQPLPKVSEMVSNNFGCSSKVELVTDWDKVTNEATQINWVTFIISLVIIIIIFEVLDVLVLPERLIIFIMLLLAFSTTFFVLYLFLLRKYSYIIFSTVLGGLLGSFIHSAFIAEGKITIEGIKKKFNL